MKLIRGYPEYMRELIEKVEQTRGRRMRETFKPMTMDEREEVLNKFHPDFIKEAKRAIKIGTNKGDLMPHEVADLLEAHPVIKPEDVDLTRIDYDSDILIIGGGGAGLVAALWAYYSGIKPENILIVQKLRVGDSNSIMSQGGVQAATKPIDSPAIHYLDALGGGHFTNKPDLVRAMVNDGPEIIKWLEELGVIFDRDPKGDLQSIHGGGTSRKRMLSCKDYTGMEIVRVLRDEVRNLEIQSIELTSAVELIMDDLGQVAGAVLYNMETNQYYVAIAKSTILATGGFGRLHIQNFPTTNHYGATADGLVIAYHAGAKLRDMDAVQYHPTGAAFPEQIVGQLITEKVRGLGAQPINKFGEMFVFPLEPRDVESAAIIRECYGRDNGITTPTGLRGVWLDSPLIEMIHGEGTVQKELSAMYRQYKRFDIDLSKDPILTFPTLHYQNGGVEIDQFTKTNVPGLFAAGEVTGGVHGKNRLMGNSVLDYNVFGRRAGIYAAKHAQHAKIGKLTLAHLTSYEKMLNEARITTARKAPILLPEYRGKEVLSRALDIF